MSVHEILSTSNDRPSGQFDYVDGEGNVLPGSVGDDAHYREEPDEYEFRMMREWIDGRGDPEVAARKKQDERGDMVAEYADKRGCSPEMAAWALYGCSMDQLNGIDSESEGAVGQASSVEEAPQKKWKKLNGRSGLEPASGAMITAEINHRLRKITSELGRYPTEEEELEIAAAVESQLRNI